MYALNFTLNVMTLMALSLAVGLLIDDAIVVIENIYRHMHEGATPMEAAKAATSEIGLAVMATRFTIVAVFIPVAFMSGIVGRFLLSVRHHDRGIGSGLSLCGVHAHPMLASRWLRPHDEDLSNEGNYFRRGLYLFNRFFDTLSQRYRRAITWSARPTGA